MENLENEEKLLNIANEIGGILEQEGLTTIEVLAILNSLFVGINCDIIELASKEDLNKKHLLMSNILDKMRVDFQSILFGIEGGNC